MSVFKNVKNGCDDSGEIDVRLLGSITAMLLLTIAMLSLTCVIRVSNTKHSTIASFNSIITSCFHSLVIAGATPPARHPVCCHRQLLPRQRPTAIAQG